MAGVSVANGNTLAFYDLNRLLLQFKTNKVIYRRYAGLYFSLCVDVTDNELAYLESIHLFVEILDHYFSNVCELDLVFNFHKVVYLPRGPPRAVSRLHRLVAVMSYGLLRPCDSRIAVRSCQGHSSIHRL